MSENLLRTWLDVTRAALDAPADQALDAFVHATDRRAELREALERTAPGSARDALRGGLAAELEAAERDFQARAIALLDGARETLGRVRDARSAARGYRPVRGTRPSFVSRSV